MRLNDKQRDYLVKHFKHTKNQELLEKINEYGDKISFRTMLRYAYKLGLKKSKQFIRKTQDYALQKAHELNEMTGYAKQSYFAQMQSKKNGFVNKGWFKEGESCVDRIGNEAEARRIENSRKSRNATIQKELRRIDLGLEQKTNINLTKMIDKKEIGQRYRAKKLGYIVVRGEQTIFYDKNTPRNTRLENTLSKSGIVFMPLSLRNKNTNIGCMVCAGTMIE